MKKLFVFLPFILTILSCREEGLKVIGGEGVEIFPFYKAELSVKNNVVEVHSIHENDGVIFKGNWNLTGYNRLRLKITNLDKEEHISLMVSLCNDTQEKLPWRSWSSIVFGKTDDRYQVRPDGTTEITIMLPRPISHPEIDRQFTTMLNTPYSRNHFIYSVDYKNITSIEIHQRFNQTGIRWKVSDVEFLRGELEDNPPYMELDSAAFFPFIDRYGQFKHKDWPGKIHCDKELLYAREQEEKDLAAHPGPDGWDKYGGYSAGGEYEATGHFRVQKIDGKWWMIDPDGHLFFSHGILRVSPANAVTPLSAPGLRDRRYFFEELPQENDPDFGVFYTTFDPLLGSYYAARQIDDHYDFSSANCLRKYGPDYMQVYGELAHRRLRSWGMNTMANASESKICMMHRTPYCDRLEIKSKSMTTKKATLWWNLPDPFDQDFRAEIDRQLISRMNEINDPWCIGYFVDNEHVWGDGTHVTQCALEAPDSAAVKIALRSWLKEKYGRDIPFEDMTMQDKSEFNDVVIDKYYRTIREEFDRLAPGLLYMGCRFGGNPGNPRVIQIGAKYCDVISYNIYRYTLDALRLPEGVDKPIMIGEFHFGAMDRGVFHPSQVKAESQEDRARCYKEYLYSALRHPNVIGTHWHQFSDQATTGRFDGENLQCGFTDVCDTPYRETIEACREVGYHLYKTRLTAKTR